MALRSLLTVAERGQILALPTGTEDLEAHYTPSDGDMSLIRGLRRIGTKFHVRRQAPFYASCLET